MPACVCRSAKQTITLRRRAPYDTVWHRVAACGNFWQFVARWKTVEMLARLEIAGKAGNCWQGWKLLARLEIAGKAGNCWQGWKLLARLERKWVTLFQLSSNL